MYGVAHEDCEREARKLEQSMSEVRILGALPTFTDRVISEITPIYYLHVPESGSGENVSPVCFQPLCVPSGTLCFG